MHRERENTQYLESIYTTFAMIWKSTADPLRNRVGNSAASRSSLSV